MAEYKAPVTAGEMPSATLSGNGADSPVSLAVGGGYLYVADRDHGGISSFKLPITTNEMPEQSLAINNAHGVAFGGNVIYVASPDTLAAYALPITTGEQPAVRFSLTNTDQFAVDSRYLYVSSHDNGGRVSAYPLPLTNGESPAVILPVPSDPGGLAVNALHLYVASGLGGLLSNLAYSAHGKRPRSLNGTVEVYNLPLTNREQPSATLTLSGRAAGGLALDAKQLCVSDATAAVSVYGLPIKSAESASATLSVPAPYGLAIAP